MDPRIADYIRANRRAYTREAITKQLLEAGHDPTEIERTWAALDTPDADDVAGEGFWGRFALIVIGINLAVFLAVGLLTGMLANLASGGILLVILAIAMAIGALIAWAVVASTGPAKLSRRSALVIGAAIPALFAFLIGGTCYALVGSLGGMGTPGPQPLSGDMSIRIEGAFDLDEQMGAFCHAEGGGGFFVSAESVIGPEGRPLFVSIATTVADPSGDVRPSLNLELPPVTGDSFSQWGTDTGQPAEEVEWTVDPSGGTVAFRGLPGMQHGATTSSALPSISGEITWTCESRRDP